MLELSRTVPVVVDLWAEWCGPCKQLSPVIEKVVTELDGRVVLVKVDVDANPQLAQAFRAQSIPMVVGLVGGQPVPLFTGAVPEQQVREVLGQLLQLAAQHGVTGTVPREDGDGAETEPAKAPLPPLHAEAFAAIEEGDYARAIAAYEKALAENLATRTLRPDSGRCVCSTASRVSTSRRRDRRPRRTPPTFRRRCSWRIWMSRVATSMTPSSVSSI